MRREFKYRVRRAIALIVSAIITGIILGQAINLIWWMDDHTPRLWGAFWGAVMALWIMALIKESRRGDR